VRVLFERSGGFAGLKLQGSLDSANLSRSEACRLERLLKQSRFFNLPATLRSSSPGADRFNYKVTVETAGTRHTVEASEAAVPAEMRPLLDFLTRSLFVK